jgi:hypothetical protein
MEDEGMKETKNRNVAFRWIGMVVLLGTALANAGTRIWDYSVIMQVTIDRPVKKVWPYLFGDKEKLWTKVDYKRVAGEPGRVGDLYMQEYPATPAYPGGQLFYEAIKVTPEKQIVLKITRKENDKDESRLIGYDFETLNEVAGHTTVVLQQAAAFPVNNLPNKQENDKQDNKMLADQNTMLADIFRNLKTAVESGEQVIR